MLVIVDYKLGNINSVCKAFKFLNARPVVSNDPLVIKKANYLVLPGVGAFGDGARNLKKLNLASALKQKVLQDKTPILGICLGMQLLANESFEGGHFKGLGIIDGSVVKINSADLRLPHMGWDDVEPHSSNKKQLFKGTTGNCFYFAHSYFFHTKQLFCIRLVELY